MVFLRLSIKYTLIGITFKLHAQGRSSFSFLSPFELSIRFVGLCLRMHAADDSPQAVGKGPRQLVVTASVRGEQQQQQPSKGMGG